MISRKTILFVSQDEGSGNALAPVIKALSRDPVRLKVVAGKFSKRIFQESGIGFTDLETGNLGHILDVVPDLIVTGGSMRNSLEKEAIRYAGQHEIRSMTILDFWGNYWERFTIDGKPDPDLLPDKILIPDPTAREQMIQENFPAEKLVVTGNPYFDTFRLLKSQKSPAVLTTVLFISQPEYKNGHYLTDLRKLRRVVKIILETQNLAKLIIKPHPREDAASFKSLIRSPKIIIFEGKGIKSLIAEADIIIGSDSTVLFESVFCGKPVISYQPGRKKTDRLVTNRMGLSYRAKSIEELRTMIHNISSGELKPGPVPRIKYYNDGKCCSRVLKEVKKYLNGQKVTNKKEKT